MTCVAIPWAVTSVTFPTKTPCYSLPSVPDLTRRHLFCRAAEVPTVSSSSAGVPAGKGAAVINGGQGAVAVGGGEEAALTASSVVDAAVVLRGGEDATSGEEETQG